MNRSLLIDILNSEEAQKFIEKNKTLNSSEILLKKSASNLPLKEIAEQIDCLQKAEIKLPELNTYKLIYKKIPLEQSSSEQTARYKSKILKGNKIIDLTGGLGIDSIYFSKSFEEVVYCELNEELAAIAAHNFKTLKINNITVNNGDGIEILKKYKDEYFDWVFADPSRRDKDKRSVDIKYYSPDVVSNLDLFIQKSQNICLKLAPAFDLKEAERIFPKMNEFSVVSVKNECKEVLVYFNKKNERKIKSAVILNDNNEPVIINNSINEKNNIKISLPEKDIYFYEPDAAIRKAGLTKHIADKYKLKFINRLSNYLISEKEIEDFPGRKFKILFTCQFNLKKVRQYLSREKIIKANITRSNFPDKPEIIKEKLKLKDGGDYYLFFTKDKNGKLIFINTSK
ncbi:MAG: RsmD family RNA methyltransferase [Bacteroidetes bacterium]|nr:RsmD family RNA methyltransferase [Bacteroidota bacterium]